jgi:thiamine pyrophosphokinase
MGLGIMFAGDGNSAKVEIIIDGNSVPTYLHKGKTYIEAFKGKEYSIRISNPLGERVGVALSVDGLNTIDAKQTKAAKAAKWILDPYESIIISGWQVSDQQARQFFFTSEDQSYGAKLGKTDNFGLISATFFRERRPQAIQPQYPLYLPFPSPYPYPGPIIGSMGGIIGGGMGGMGGGGGFGGSGSAGAGPGARPGTPSVASGSRISQPGADSSSSKTSKPEYAATGMGSRRDHEVESVHLILENKSFATINLRYEFRDALVKLKVPLDRPVEKDPLLRREKARGFGGGQFSPEP